MGFQPEHENLSHYQRDDGNGPFDTSKGFDEGMQVQGTTTPLNLVVNKKDQFMLVIPFSALIGIGFGVFYSIEPSNYFKVLHY